MRKFDPVTTSIFGLDEVINSIVCEVSRLTLSVSASHVHRCIFMPGLILSVCHRSLFPLFRCLDPPVLNFLVTNIYTQFKKFVAFKHVPSFSKDYIHCTASSLLRTKYRAKPCGSQLTVVGTQWCLSKWAHPTSDHIFWQFPVTGIDKTKGSSGSGTSPAMARIIVAFYFKWMTRSSSFVRIRMLHARPSRSKLSRRNAERRHDCICTQKVNRNRIIKCFVKM